MKAMILCWTLGLIAIGSQAATFYCDPTNGTATNDGSAEHPWRTIGEVIGTAKIELRDPNGKVTNPNAAVKSGDTLLLRSGWHGVLRINAGYNENGRGFNPPNDNLP